MAQRRNRRSGVEDLWAKTIRHPDGKTEKVESKLHGTRPNTRWRARYVGPDGVERTKGFPAKAEAQEWINEQVADQQRGEWVNPDLSALTFGKMAERWLQTKAHRAPKTVAGYESLLTTVILPRWRDVPLRDIHYDALQVWIAELSASGSVRFDGKGLSASRVRQAHQLVGAVLKFAVRSRYLPANPADGIELPRLPEHEQRYLTHEQLQRLAVASGRFRTLVLVLGYCGLRFGEVAALRVGNVDLKARRIRVARSVTSVPGKGLVEGPTKNHSARTVPVPRNLVRLLKTEIGGRDAKAVLFAPQRGDWLTLGMVRWVFDPAAKAAAVEGLRLQDLRHTCASLSIRAGANVKVLQRLLGHKTATLTLDRYGHLFPDDLDSVADALNEAWESTAYELRTSRPRNRSTAGPETL